MTLRRAIGPIPKPRREPKAPRKLLRSRGPKRDTGRPLDRALAGTVLETPRQPVTVSTAPRDVGPALDRQRPVLSPSLLAWVREQPCELPGSAQHPWNPGSHPGGDPHHTPTTGANGRQIDDCVVSACRLGHQLAHGGKFTPEQVDAAAHRTWVRFRRLAPLALQRKVAEEIAASLK